MKKLISKAGFIVLTVVLLAGCGNSTSKLREDLTDSVNQKEEESTTVSDGIELTENVEEPIEKEEEEIFESTVEILPAMDEIPTEIAEVFYDNKPFNYVYLAWPTGYDGEKIPRDSMRICVKDFVYDAYIDVLEDGSLDIIKYNVQWEKYTILDLDNDGTNELVYYVYPGGNGFYIIFHVIDGEVYGYSELYRDVSELYKDGTIAGESGASWFWLKKITAFDKAGYSEEIFARQEDDFYTINDKEVTAVEFCEYTAKWNLNDGSLTVEWIATNESEDASLTEKQKESLKSHFEIIKEDREGGFVYVCVDGMEIHKYKVDNGIFDGNVDISFKVQDTDFAGLPNKTILVQLTNDIVYSDAGHMSYDAVFPECKDIVSHYIANSDNIFLYEEVEHDTTKMGYLKDFDYENRTIKIDYATEEISSPSGGIRLEGNDGIFEEEKISSDVRFEFFYGHSCEATLKGFQDRMDRDTDSSMGYSIYFKNGEVVGIADIPSA